MSRFSTLEQMNASGKFLNAHQRTHQSILRDLRSQLFYNFEAMYMVMSVDTRLATYPARDQLIGTLQ